MAASERQVALFASSKMLPAIPPEASTGYTQVLPELVLAVNERMRAHPSYAEWLGAHPPQLLSDNHRHAGQFMDEIFATSNFDLLAASLPWVYNAYHMRGVPYDYFQHELSCWKEVVAGALPSQQAKAINQVYDWMLAQHESVIALAAERAPLVKPVDPELAEIFASVIDAALAHDADRVLQLCRAKREEGMTLPALLQLLIYPLMRRVGCLWETNELSFSAEHEITAMINRVLAALYFDQPFPMPARGRALVAASMNEYHEMGAWMVATCLELDGWDVDYLGVNLDQTALLRRAGEFQPHLVALSVSMPFNLRAARQAIAALREQLPGTTVMIGGQVFQLLPELAEGMGADVCLHDCQAAMHWARSMSCGFDGDQSLNGREDD
ncbi:MAG: cobalamin B12-binding domain-containing protein [Lamprobacter sp.]|uniref:cobalamin B12-binding domain-containing protein n=1 Tax=Lamprobacter sp. TaxID=3100796 RepID=UPI002B25CD1C|nr:cobalamin B12-binding domain-containing protein [Lamprobacter sp.]MEA3640494.1 cobalamin B12-binding domain-containing protein [Lamprobacter sp.]